MLFAPDEHVVARASTAASCGRSAWLFVPRSTGRAFLGYLDAQRAALTGERHPSRTREVSRLQGYDTEYAMRPFANRVARHRA